jgi:hypothetical protein
MSRPRFDWTKPYLPLRSTAALYSANRVAERAVAASHGLVTYDHARGGWSDEADEPTPPRHRRNPFAR